jgi:hypothetical protein
MDFERRSTRKHYAENSLWKRLWICRQAGYRINELQIPACSGFTSCHLGLWAKTYDIRQTNSTARSSTWCYLLVLSKKIELAGRSINAGRIKHLPESKQTEILITFCWIFNQTAR